MKRRTKAYKNETLEKLFNFEPFLKNKENEIKLVKISHLVNIYVRNVRFAVYNLNTFEIKHV